MASKTSFVNKFFNFARNLVTRGNSILNAALDVNYFFSNIYVPLAVLVLYFVSFEYLISDILNIPNGVNFVFVSRAWKYFSLLAVASSWIFLAILKIKKGGEVSF